MQAKITEAKSLFSSLLLIAPFFLWGTAMVAMKDVVPHTTPLFMAGIRLLPAGIIVVIAGALMGKPQPQGVKAWLWISLFALVDGAMFQGFLAEGLVRTGAGLGSVMIDSQPIAVALLCLWLFGEKIGPWGWLGLAIGVLGISLIGLPDEWIWGWLQGNGIAMTLDFSQLWQNGEWLMLLAALSMAIGTVTVRAVCRYADPVTATGWHMILGGVPMFLLSGMTESEQWVNLDLGNYLSLTYSTVFGSAIAYGLFFYFASTGNLTSFSSLTFLTPVFALLFGNLFLGEVLSPVQSIGVCLTLVSIYLINQRDVIAERLNQILTNNSQSNQTSLPTEENINQLESSPPEISLPVSVIKSESELL